jgi:hypothetical protein
MESKYMESYFLNQGGNYCFSTLYWRVKWHKLSNGGGRRIQPFSGFAGEALENGEERSGVLRKDENLELDKGFL